MKLPEVTWEWDAQPTMRSYLQTHDGWDIFLRVVRGVRGEFALLADNMDTLFPIPGLGVILFLFFGIGLVIDRNRARRLTTLIMLAAFFIPFAWYFPAVAAPRFISPLIPLMCLYAAVGIVGMRQFLSQAILSQFRIPSLDRLTLALTVFLTVLVGYVVATRQVALTTNRAAALSEDEYELFDWAEHHVKHEDMLLVGRSSLA